MRSVGAELFHPDSKKTSCLKFTNKSFKFCYSVLKASSQREMSVSRSEREVFTGFQYGYEHV
jgi:hypothetical protein